MTPYFWVYKEPLAPSHSQSIHPTHSHPIYVSTSRYSTKLMPPYSTVSTGPRYSAEKTSSNNSGSTYRYLRAKSFNLSRWAGWRHFLCHKELHVESWLRHGVM